MTCRAACVPLEPEPIGAIYLELAEAGRWDDFRWLAESQGLTAPRIAELWDGLRARRRPCAIGTRRMTQLPH
jgi:hypothetical protein